MTSVAHPTGNPDESFSYTDPIGSVGNRTDSHLSSSYTYDDLNRLLSDDEYTYGYDADGNLVLKTLISDSSYTMYYYNAENKLVQVKQYDEFSTLILSSTYEYDGFGRRVKKDVDGVVRYYIYDNEDIRFETDGVGTIIGEYTHGSGIDEPLSMRRNGQNYYYHVNGLGTVTALTDSNKAVVQEYVYDSFGRIINQTGTIENPYTYTAREYDTETGLYYYRARYYDASVGRFVSDGGTNLYVYVRNNPVNFVDPYGLAIIRPPLPAEKEFRKLIVCRKFYSNICEKNRKECYKKCDKIKDECGKNYTITVSCVNCYPTYIICKIVNPIARMVCHIKHDPITPYPIP